MELEEMKLKKKAERANRAINERIEQDDIIRNQINSKLNLEKENALKSIFNQEEKENSNTVNMKQVRSSGVSSKEGKLINSIEQAHKLKDMSIRQIPKNKSKIELKFTEKVYPHLAMREKFLKKLPDPKPKNEKSNKKDEHNFLFYKDKGDEFLHKGDIEGAIEAYNICLELNEDCVKAIVNKSLANFRKLDYPECLNDIEQALNILCQREEILRYRGKWF
jgi:tetratricopeptide (TPR) repeat protein